MKNTILLVDNIKAFKDLHSKLTLLTETDVEIQSVSNGLEALDVINKYLRGSASVTDFIFIDLNMPVMDGLEFVRVFKGMDSYRRTKISIVVCIAALDQKNRERAVKLDIDYLVSRPLTDEDIRSLV
jgi:CheY-like chemotaxis protein